MEQRDKGTGVGSETAGFEHRLTGTHVGSVSINSMP